MFNNYFGIKNDFTKYLKRAIRNVLINISPSNIFLTLLSSEMKNFTITRLFWPQCALSDKDAFLLLEAYFTHSCLKISLTSVLYTHYTQRETLKSMMN